MGKLGFLAYPARKSQLRHGESVISTLVGGVYIHQNRQLEQFLLAENFHKSQSGKITENRTPGFEPIARLC